MKVNLITELGKVHVELTPETDEDERALELLAHPILQGSFSYSGKREKQEKSKTIVSKVSYSIIVSELRKDEYPVEGMKDLNLRMLKDVQVLRAKPREALIAASVQKGKD